MAGAPDDKTPKVMDAVHPAGSNPRPSSNSRPTIVANHRYIKNDPMINTTVEEPPEQTTSPEQPKSAGEKVVDTNIQKPEDETDKKDGPKEEIKSSETAVDTAPTETSQEEPSPTEPTVPESADSKPELAEPLVINPPEEEDASKEAPEEVPEATVTDDETSQAQENVNVGGDPITAVIKMPESQPNQDDSEQQAREAELERMIAAGTYAVPINGAKRRRSWVFLTILLVVVVALIVVDVLADMEVLSLPFGLPSTNFFVK